MRRYNILLLQETVDYLLILLKTSFFPWKIRIFTSSLSFTSCRVFHKLFSLINCQHAYFKIIWLTMKIYTFLSFGIVWPCYISTYRYIHIYNVKKSLRIHKVKGTNQLRIDSIKLKKLSNDKVSHLIINSSTTTYNSLSLKSNTMLYSHEKGLD